MAGKHEKMLIRKKKRGKELGGGSTSLGPLPHYIWLSIDFDDD